MSTPVTQPAHATVIEVGQPEKPTPSLCRQTAYCWAPLACCGLSMLGSGIALWTQGDRLCDGCALGGQILTLVPAGLAGLAAVCMLGQACLNRSGAR